MVHKRVLPDDRRGEFRRREIISKTQKSERNAGLKISSALNSFFRTFLYLVVLAVALYFLFISSVFKIKQVDISGVKSTEISDYINKSLLDKNIITFAPATFLKELSSAYPVIEEAKIVRGLPSTVRIDVIEREQMLIVCGNKCFEVDTNGVAYQELDRPSDKMVLSDRSGIDSKIGDQLASERFIDFYLKALKQFEDLGLKTTEAYITDTTFKMTFKTSEGWEAIFDTSGSLINQIDALKQVLEKNRSEIKEYVDLRVEGQVYLK